MKIKLTSKIILILLSLIFISSCAGTSAKCGNGIKENSEECDDGNLTPGDGCSSSCQLENFCGNGICENDEIHSCPQDCKVCGNGKCDEGESIVTCTLDCFCTNGTCDSGEDAFTCPADCEDYFECGNSICEPAESISTCSSDCFCTNGTCDNGETTVTCPQDCSTSTCGNSICEPTESISSCSTDCFCTNGTCDNGEDTNTCPADCTTSPNCGNGIIETGEQCDNSNLNSKTCIDMGFDGGVLKCTSSCSFDTSQCTQNTQCLVVPQNGCSIGEKCTVDTATTTRCISAGNSGEMAPCSTDADCAAGLSCATVNAFTNEGACRRFCRDKTPAYDSLDCIGSAGSACYYDINDANRNPVPTLHLCTAPCDPVNSTGCLPSMKCNIYGLDRDNDNIIESYSTECYAKQDSNYYCNGTQVCPDGYECFDFGYGQNCYRWCSTQDDPCSSLGMSCYSFPTEQVIIGGVEYGYCDN